MRLAVLTAACFAASSLAQAAEPPPPPSADSVKAVCAEAADRYSGLKLAPPGGGPVVLMYKYVFCPPGITVKAGSKVTFVNVDKRTSHSAWFRTLGQDESPRLFPEESWSITFDQPGEYPVLCGPHWEQEKMVGAVTVVR